MKSLPGREVFSWDVGRVEEAGGGGGIVVRSVSTSFSAVGFQRLPAG